MTTTAQLTAAPLEFTVGEKTYRMSPFSDKDFGILELWMQDKYIALAKRSLDGLPIEVQKDLLRHAYDKASHLTVTSKEGSEVLSSLEGGIQLALISLRHNHPNITYEEVMNLMQNPHTALALQERIAELNRARPFAVKRTSISNKEKAIARRRPVLQRTKHKRT